MKNIREWYGVNKVAQGVTEESLDALLVLYAKAITKYFSCEDAVSSVELIRSARKQQLSEGQRIFLDWFESKGEPKIKEALLKKLPENDDLAAQFDYEKYILEEEMDFEYPEDVRASLVGIVSDLSMRIEVSVTIESTLLATSLSDTYNMSRNIYEYLDLNINVNLPIGQVSFLTPVGGKEYILSNCKL